MSKNDKWNSAASFGAEGTTELDQAALLAHLEADSRDALELEPDPVDPREPTAMPYLRPDADTIASPAVLRTTAAVPQPRPGPTQHYEVPTALLEQAQRVEEIRHMPTIPIDAVIHDVGATETFSGNDLLEFEAVIDALGRIALPDSALGDRFQPGRAVKVVIVPVDEEP